MIAPQKSWLIFMPKSIILRGVVLLCAVASPVLVCAQFQPPTDEELKMTSDPKAPGAAAVYLDYEEIANDPLHYESTYARIKVLTEKGKSLATVDLPYFLKGTTKITDIKGRTIQPDGTIVPLTVKPEDLVVVKTGDYQVERKVFTLPSVEVGSILEYRYDLEYDDNTFSSPQWDIQQPYFVHKAHYQFTPEPSFMPSGSVAAGRAVYELTDSRGRIASSLIWWQRLPPGVKMQTSINGSYTVDVTDVPPTPDEDHMPPIQSFLYKVGFFYSYAHDPPAYWASEVKLWSKDVDKFAEPSKTISDAVNGLIAPNDSELDKAKKLYDAVEALDNTDYTRKKSASELQELKVKEARNAMDTWTQKSGSSDDIASLYLSMARAAGLTAYAIRVVDRDKNTFDPSDMSLDQLDSTLVALTIGGKQIVVDPGEKMCPFTIVSWRHSDASGIGQSAEGGSFVTTPMQQYKDNVTSRLGDVYLDAQGGITGHINVIMVGQAALHWRQRALEEDDAELKKEFDREELQGKVPDGVEAHVDHFLSMSDPYTNLMAVVNVTGSLGTATGKRLILPGFFFETRGSIPFVNEDKRMEPVDMHFGNRVTDDVTYHLPDGMTVEGAPQDTSIPWPGHALLVAKSVAQPGQITIGQTLSVAFTLAKPEEYQDLRGFYQKVAAADQEQLVLTASPAAPVGKGD
jgi:transglutaminase-like putative cysteine protease